MLRASDDTRSQRQRQTSATGSGRRGGRKEESAQAQPLRRAARTTAAAAAGPAGGAPGGTCAQAARPAPRISLPRPLARSAGRREQGRRSRAACDPAGARAGAGAHPTSHLVGFLDWVLRFLPGARPALPAHACSPACSSTRWISKHPRPDRPLRRGSPGAGGLANSHGIPALATYRESPARLLFL